MSLLNIANGCKGSEGTITLGPDDAQELLDMVKENGQEYLLEEAPSSTALLTGQNKDEEARKKSRQAEPEGSFVSLGNGGIEVSCIVLNAIVFGDQEEFPPKKVKRSAFAAQLSPSGPRKAVAETVKADETEEVSEVSEMNVSEASHAVSNMRSVEKLQHILATDTRVGVRNAVEKRLSELSQG